MNYNYKQYYSICCFIIIVITLFITPIVIANNFTSEEWKVAWGDKEHNHSCNAVAVDSKCNVYIVGNTLNGDRKIVLVKYNKDGVKIWSKLWGEGIGTHGLDLEIDSKDNVYVVGYCHNENQGENYDIVLIKYDENGNLFWSKIWEATNVVDEARGIVIDSSGNIYVTGVYNNYIEKGSLVLIKFDSSGVIRWYRTWSGNGYAVGNDVVIDSNNNLYVVGFTRTPNSGGGSKIILLKYSSVGAKLWSNIINNEKNEYNEEVEYKEGYGVTIDSKDNIYITGVRHKKINTDTDMILFKYTNDGKFQWNRTWNKNKYNRGYGIAINSEEEIFVVGETSDDYNEKYDFFLVKYNNSGEKERDGIWNGGYNERGKGIAIDFNDNLYLAGITDEDTNYHKMLLIKIPKKLKAELNVETMNILILIIFSTIGLVGLLGVNSYYNWNIVNIIKKKLSNFHFSLYIKKQKNVRELEASKFENLILKSKDFVNKGNKYYSKKNYIEAVNNWDKAGKTFGIAIEMTTSSTQKEKISENIRSIRKRICKAHIEKGKESNRVANKAYNKKDFNKIDTEWRLAIHYFNLAIDLIKKEKFEISSKDIKIKIQSIEFFLKKIEIEKIIQKADKNQEKAMVLRDKNITEAVKISQDSLKQYLEAKSKVGKEPRFQKVIEVIQNKMMKTRNLQIKLYEKMDKMMGIAPFDMKADINNEPNFVGRDIKKKHEITTDLLIIREYEFIGGQVRFKIALKNKTHNPLTDFKITFDIPKALKWVRLEPDYERSGDTILLPKLGKKEKKSISLYLEPINCMESHINATISFHDAIDRPHAITMKPKMISITCPIFFTEEEANLARVKSIWRKLNHQDRKVFPIVNPTKTPFIFETVLSILGKYDIKLVSKEFSKKDKFGEAWYYATTKVGKNKLVGYIIIDANKKTLEFRVSGDNEDQITAFLAEIGGSIRKKLIKYNVISISDKFYNMSASVLSNTCPYCGDRLSYESVQKYLEGQKIKCKYCNVEIIKNEL